MEHPKRIAGIIAEYNPFHLGHKYLLDVARESGAEVIIVAMSGNYVQRGEPALLSKYYRAEAALNSGADMVAEIPLPWAMARAETFARGGVHILSALGCTELWFGSECGDTAMLEKAACILESDRFQTKLHPYIDSGFSFASAREAAVKELDPACAQLLQEPNNTLGIEYCRAILQQNSLMKPHAILRKGSGHHDTKAANFMASGTALRDMIRKNKSPAEWFLCLPKHSAEYIQAAIEKGEAPSRPELIERAILSSLRQMSREDIAKLPDISEGLENRIYEAVQKSGSLSQLMAFVKTKRYSHARIRRILLAGYLGLQAEDTLGMPPYLRILGFSSQGEKYLKHISHNNDLPLLTTAAQAHELKGTAEKIFETECRSTDLFALSLPIPPACGEEYRHKLIKPNFD